MRAFFRASPRSLAAAAVIMAVSASLAVAQPGNEKKSSDAGVLDAGRGVLVAAVEPGSPADKAGIARGDIIIEAAGQPVDTPEQLKAAIEAKKPGDAIGLKVRHGDRVRAVKVELADNAGRAVLGVLPVPSLGSQGPGPAGPGPKGPGRQAPAPGDQRGTRPGDQSEWPWGQGARVASVAQAGPAAQAGLAKGDVILSVDGKQIGGGDSLSEMIAAHKPGDAVTLSVQSPGKEPRDVKVTLGKKADTDAPYLGVEYTAAGPRMPWNGIPWGNPKDGGIGVRGGVLVTGVVEGGPAEKAGLKQNDLVTALDGARVRSPQAVAEAVASRKPGSVVTLTVVRMPDTKELAIEVTLGENPTSAGKGFLGISMSRFMGFQGPERPDSDSGPTPWGLPGMPHRWMMPWGGGQGRPGGEQPPADAPPGI
jgi:S1-C subfamily serine protease